MLSLIIFTIVSHYLDILAKAYYNSSKSFRSRNLKVPLVLPPGKMWFVMGNISRHHLDYCSWQATWRKAGNTEIEVLDAKPKAGLR